jgi:hypothetical protein
VNSLPPGSIHTQQRPDFNDGPLRIIGATLLSVAALDYWVYDRFLLSYVLAAQCHGCDAHSHAPSSEELQTVAAAGSVYLALLISVPQALRRAVWGWGTLLSALSTTLLLARAHAQTVMGVSERWAALNEPVRLALYCGASLTLSTLVLAVRGPRRLDFSSGTAGVVAIAGIRLTDFGAGGWFRASTMEPVAKAALLLAGSGDVVTWWKRSLAAVLTAGALLAIVAARRGHRQRRSAWLWLVAGLAAVWLTIPHARDALQPLPWQDTVPVGLSRVSTCLARYLPAEPLPLDSAEPKGPVLVKANAAGYLPASFTTPASALGPSLQKALNLGIHWVVVPATRSRAVSSHTLGLLHYDDVCLGGQFRLSSGAESRPLAAFATLGDLIRSDSAIDPSAAPARN